ncbi:MAG: DNA mismatch repair endonuclease MutL [Desulfobacterales bacterium]|nr:DNA mismatch repair endonuclease MutL [Desulfobacterales bacterium]
MSKIKILPEILSNKIAAGEVVERPASVVKELVENSLDAGSSRIMIDIAQGGRSLIRVSDNGSGMGRDDALLALERYATSKIYRDRDLFNIRTLGFRGEALPSIASVSRFRLTSREASADAGTEIRVEGGKIKNVTEAGAPRGTLVSVRQLFFNTPARRKFLKTVATEMGHIADRISSIALGHPGIQFRLTHNDKIVKDWPAASSNFERVVDVLGGDLKTGLHALQYKSDGISLSGWISSPRAHRRTARAIYIYVNGRSVRDRMVQHALFEGYAQRLVKGQFPLAVIFIEVPFDEVDVNVHPTKSEVRFARQKAVHEAVRRAVAQTLYETDRTGWGAEGGQKGDAHDAETRAAQQVAETNRTDFGFGISDLGFKKGNSGFNYGEKDSRHESFEEFEYLPPQTQSRDAQPTPRTRQPGTPTLLPESHPAPRTSQPDSPSVQAEIWQKKRFGSLRVIGQLHNTYIVCEADAGLILIDQHAAHERILFESLSARSADRKPSAQRLLVPETVELGFREAGVLESLIPELNELGLEIDHFGGNTFVVKSVPGLLAGREIRPLITEIVETVAAVGAAPGLDRALESCRMVMACHGAIRANQALNDQQIRGLLDQLDGCHNPSHCPHGRPTWLRWEIRELEKLFKRIV